MAWQRDRAWAAHEEHIADGERIREGYLVLADVSGYTAFLTGTSWSTRRRLSTS